MNSYFFKMTNEEKNNILDQHKEVYDGYVTQYAQSNEQPLYTQDFANDKQGLTVNNKGVVTLKRISSRLSSHSLTTTSRTGHHNVFTTNDVTNQVFPLE